ncbi:hypothetical protein ACJJTC_011042 [Scirpophaga incertulas]
MFKNPNYVYGPKDAVFPARLHIGDYILSCMVNYGDKIALEHVATGEILRYSEIVQKCMNTAISLGHLGVKKGQVVAICSENRKEYWAALTGILCASAVVTTINPAYVEGEIRHAIQISKPSCIICSPLAYKTHGKTLKSLKQIRKIIIFGNERIDNAIPFDDLSVPVVDDSAGDVFVDNRLRRNVRYNEFEVADVVGQVDTAFISYSSGTTGMPKGVMLTHANVISACTLVTHEDLMQRVLSITPWFHAMGLMGTIIGLCKGRSALYMPRFEPDLYLRTIEKYKIKYLPVVPPVVVMIGKTQGEYDLSSVEHIYSGGAPLHKETIDLIKAKLPKVHILQGYGMTEATLAVTRDNNAEVLRLKPGSVGTAVSNAIVKIADIETRQALGPNQPGELCVKGPMIMKGYVGKDRNEDFDEEGFFRTGDIAYYDEDGFFFIVDRLKELIKYKAFQVAPAELESLLLKHESVKDAGVVGLPDTAAGELPLAFVVKQPGAQVTEKEIQQFIADKVSNPKRLRGGVRFVEEIPKNPSGKILRKELKKMAKKVKSKL